MLELEEYDVYRIIIVLLSVSIGISALGLVLVLLGIPTRLTETITIEAYMSALASLDPLAIIYLGILSLLCIPLLVLGYLVIAYMVNNEKKMSFLTLLALVMIIMIAFLRYYLL